VKLQESNPAEYKQITGQIATALQNTATNEQASGDTQSASGLTQLAKVFQTASQSGNPLQFPATSSTVASGGYPNSRIVGGADPNIVGGADPNIVGGADPNIVGGADPNIVGGADPNIVGGADPTAIIFNTLHGAGLICHG
jgi:hypothetical protein